jgi:hypothetical protein
MVNFCGSPSEGPPGGSTAASYLGGPGWQTATGPDRTGLDRKWSSLRFTGIFRENTSTETMTASFWILSDSSFTQFYALHRMVQKSLHPQCLSCCHSCHMTCTTLYCVSYWHRRSVGRSVSALFHLHPSVSSRRLIMKWPSANYRCSVTYRNAVCSYTEDAAVTWTETI